jgi:muramoyltetrapeptide carboxypeptidase
LPALRKARAIRKGAVVGIAAPAGPVEPDLIEAGEQLLSELGFEPRRRADLLDRRGYLAGDDDRRVAELMELVTDPDVGAIVCARGGYGTPRILHRLDAKAFRRAAKPLVGYSDITALLLWQRRAAGLIGIHGPMFERVHKPGDETARALVRALTGTGELPRLPGASLCPGWAEGRLVGGSLSLLVASLGTPWEVDTRDAILMIEETGEAPYRIDRMLQQLLHSGKLASAVGVGIGQLVDCDDRKYEGVELEALLQEVLAPLGVPVVTGLPFGHDVPNLAWPLGGRAAIDADRGEIELLESAVAAR